jgi:hypothetical protein
VWPGSGSQSHWQFLISDLALHSVWCLVRSRS